MKVSYIPQTYPKHANTWFDCSHEASGYRKLKEAKSIAKACANAESNDLARLGYGRTHIPWRVIRIRSKEDVVLSYRKPLRAVLAK
jgi:hypothetical protein